MATTIAETPKTADKRNLQWKQNNVGSKLLEKMGWKDGQAVGRRQREKGASAGEGMRVIKRQDGLGLGASSSAGAFGAASASRQHVQDFSNVLAVLNETHGTTKRKSKKRDRSQTTFATNRSTHAKVRRAKFQDKSDNDMKCIFGGASTFPVISAANDEGVPKKEKKSKKSKKERKDDGADSGTSEKRRKGQRKSEKKTKRSA